MSEDKDVRYEPGRNRPPASKPEVEPKAEPETEAKADEK